MIHYTLCCNNGHRFDGWFQSSDAFETQRAGGQLVCPHCGSVEVDRALMAPAVRTRAAPESAPRCEPSDEAPAKPGVDGEVIPPQPERRPAQPVVLTDEQTTQLRAAAEAFRQAIQEHATNVGKQFPEEARRIHYGEADERAIYGQASLDDVEELLDEGIEVMPLPGLVGGSN